MALKVVAVTYPYGARFFDAIGVELCGAVFEATDDADAEEQARELAREQRLVNACRAKLLAQRSERAWTIDLEDLEQ